VSAGRSRALRRELHYGDRLLLCYAERAANVDAMFRAAVAAAPSALALVDGPLRLTYAELDARVDAMAGNLAARGFAPGDRLALVLGNRAEFVFAILGAARAGVITVPIGTRNRRAENEFTLAHSGAKGVIFEASLAAEIPGTAACPALLQRFAAGGAVEGALDVAALLAPGAAAPEVEVTEEAVFCILYTSGTTGRPKGAMLTHLGVVHSCRHFETCFDLRPDDRTVVAVPASHVTGLVANILATLATGGAVIMVAAFKARALLELIAAERVSVTILVPAMYNLCLLEPDFGSFDLSAWRIGGYGGAPMPPATIEGLAARLPGLGLYNGYGATETTSPTTAMPHGMGRAKADTVGRVVPCGEIVVMGKDGRALDCGLAGELWISGPMVVPGYWENPEANAANFVGSYWKSGDIASIDAEGYVRILDRAKDMINRGGYKVFSAEVENVLSFHPNILEVALVGRPDVVLGERSVAFVVPRGEVDAASVRAFAAERLADYKVPDLVVFEGESLPRNANGKVLKAPLRERAAALDFTRGSRT